MSLHFFVDDSGKDDPPVFVLGGVAIEGDRLESFEKEWKAALAAAPAIPYLKMKEANGRRGVFRSVSAADRDTKVARLGDVLRSHATATLSVIVRHDDYRRLFERQMMRSMDRPYQIMFHLAIATAFKLHRELGRNDQAHFIFDRQLEHEADLKASWPTLRQGMIPEIIEFLGADPIHADDKEVIALQAGDMIAWHVRRSWRDGTSALETASAGGPAITSLPGKHDLINEKSLHILADVATRTAQQLNTVFPYQAERLGQAFDKGATIANFQLMLGARPFQPVELISFPATGTGKFQLVYSCANLGRPHLHRRSGNRCLGEASAV